jgi:hypothetical protein
VTHASTRHLATKALERLREISLTLPGATERRGLEDPTFRVRDKILAM